MTKDSDSHLETLTAQAAHMREEAKETADTNQQAELQRAFQSAVQREQSIQAQEKQVTDLIPPGTTRDQLLERIREMRNVKVEEPHDYYMSPEQQEQLRLEQEMGRAMVAREEEKSQRAADIRAKTEVAEKGQGEMNPVHHPNPAQDEQYPAIKATLGKPNDRLKIR